MAKGPANPGQHGARYVKEKVPMELLVPELGGRYKGHGWSGWHYVFCPLHDDRHASAQFNDDLKDDDGNKVSKFQCFVCEFSGDQFDLVVAAGKAKDFRGAMGWLSRTFELQGKAGYERPEPVRPLGWTAPDGWCEGDKPTDHDWRKPYPDGWPNPAEGWSEPQWALAYERWLPVALTAMHRAPNVPEDSEELEQVVRAAIYKTLMRFDPAKEALFSTFLSKVVYRDVIDLVRKEGKRRDREVVRNTTGERAHWPESLWAATVDWGYAEKTVAKRLGPESALRFHQHFVDEWVQRDSATLAGISLSTVKRMDKAIEHLFASEPIMGREPLAYREAMNEEDDQ
jgi:DNA-directed RNA polymerase specialized sigma24 family protein